MHNGYIPAGPIHETLRELVSRSLINYEVVCTRETLMSKRGSWILLNQAWTSTREMEM